MPSQDRHEGRASSPVPREAGVGERRSQPHILMDSFKKKSGGADEFKFIGWCRGGPPGADYSGGNRSRHGGQEKVRALK